MKKQPENLKSCPVCGLRAMLSQMGQLYMVHCSRKVSGSFGCIYGRVTNTKERAIAVWNGLRFVPEEKPQEIERHQHSQSAGSK